MKKLFLLLAAFSAIVSCSSDDDTPQKAEAALLIGTWNQYKGDFYTTYDNKTQTVYPNGCESQNTVEYNETDVNVVNYESKDGTCTPAVNKNGKYTYDKETKQLIHGKVYIVTKITPTELVTEDHNMDWDGDGKKDVTTRYFRKVK